MMNQSNIIYNLFITCGDGDGDGYGYTAFKYLRSFSTLEKAINYVKEIFNEDDDVTTPVHDSMNESNNFTYVGERENCSDYLSYHTRYGGYVIEPTILYSNNKKYKFISRLC